MRERGIWFVDPAKEMVHGACAYIFSYDFSIHTRQAWHGWSSMNGVWTDQSLHPILEMAIEGNRLLWPAHHANAPPYISQWRNACSISELHFGFFFLLVIFVSFPTADSVQSADCRWPVWERPMMIGARACVHSDVSPHTNQREPGEPLVLGGGTIDQSASRIDR